MYSIKEVLAILLRLFGVLGNVPLLPPFVTPLVMTHWWAIAQFQWTPELRQKILE